MSAGCHITFHRFGGFHVHDVGEEEGFAVLAAEVLRDMVVSVAIQLSCSDGFGIRVRGLKREVEGRTRLIISSKSARCVLQFLQPKILLELRYTLYASPITADRSRLYQHTAFEAGIATWHHQFVTRGAKWVDSRASGSVASST